jgi:hypothetical protein
MSSGVRRALVSSHFLPVIIVNGSKNILTLYHVFSYSVSNGDKYNGGKEDLIGICFYTIPG